MRWIAAAVGATACRRLTVSVGVLAVMAAVTNGDARLGVLAAVHQHGKDPLG